MRNLSFNTSKTQFLAAQTVEERSENATGIALKNNKTNTYTHKNGVISSTEHNTHNPALYTCSP